MKLKNMVAPVVFGALSLAVANANAGGTTAGTTITNTANLSYTVNSAAQTTSSVAEFDVDIKIDFTLETNNNAIQTSDLSGATVEIASIKLANAGNSSGTFTIDITDQSVGATELLYGETDVNSTTEDTYDLVGTTYTVSGTTASATASANVNNSIITVTGLGADEEISIDVFVEKSAFAGNGLNSSTLSIQEFEAKATQVTLADNTTTVAISGTDDNGNTDTNDVEIVFADEGDGVLGNNSETVLEAIQLSLPYFPDDTNLPDNQKGLLKSSTVLWDPFNLDASDASKPKAVPGSVVQYTIIVRNFGSDLLSALAISDAIPAGTTICNIATNHTSGVCIDPTAVNGARSGETVTTPVAPSFATSTASQVNAVFPTFPAGQESSITFTVTVD